MATQFGTQSREIENGRISHFILLRDGKPLRWSDVIPLWRDDRGFRTFFVSILADVSFPAYFWETPPVTRANIDQQFEFVIVDSPQLAGVRANPRAFAAHFAAAEPHSLVIEFPNLGGDAVLVAPCPGGPAAAYSQISTFSRIAPGDQQHALWQCVGRALERRVSHRPVWLNTSGLGVYWLHIRLDDAPKYYTYDPYRVP
jgi:hypothetical protein